MALDPRGAALALHRFGFGPRAGTIAAIASDPRGALMAELDRPNAGRIADAGLMSSGAAGRMASDFIAERAAKQRLETRRQEAAKQEAAKQEAAKLAAANPAMQDAAQNPAMESAGMEKPADAKSADAKTADAKTADAKPATPPPAQPGTPMLENFFREAKAHYDAAVRAELGFTERRVAQATQMADLVKRGRLEIELAGFARRRDGPRKRRVEEDIGLDERARRVVDEKAGRRQHAVEIGPRQEAERRLPIVLERKRRGEAGELVSDGGGDEIRGGSVKFDIARYVERKWRISGSYRDRWRNGSELHRL